MDLTDIQLDFLKEIINIGVGHSASILNKVVKNKVVLKVPVVRLIKIGEITSRLGYSKENLLSIVSMDFKGNLQGKAELIFPSISAVKIVDLLSDKEYPNTEMDLLRSGTLNEVGNIVLNSLIGTIGNILKSRFKYSIPKYKECNIDEIVVNYNYSSENIIFAETHFFVNEINIEGSFILFFEVNSFDHFIKLLDQSFANPDL